MPHITRAISIRQPLVELILRGKKKFEYRVVPTNLRERVYLYASLTPSDEPSLWRKVKRQPGDLPAGVIVGSVEIADCTWNGRMEVYQYKLVRPRRLKRALKAVNQPNPVFWKPRFR